jgi:DNA-binding GntR family transcriptional regulator
MIPNRGAVVIGLSESDLRDMYILRKIDEMQAVRWAIERRTKEEMESIEESLDFMVFYTQRRDTRRMRAINAGFHKKIAYAAHNRFIIDDLSRIQEYIRYSVRILPYHESDLPDILEEHRRIFAAFQNGDPDAGAAAMQKHIENSLLRANLEKRS